MCARRRWRFAALGVLIGVAMLTPIIVRTWVVQGLLLPVRVVEASMAPRLPGDHWQLRCGDCGTQFSVDAQEVTTETTVPCHVCGEFLVIGQRGQRCRGARVLVDKWRVRQTAPARWDVLAVQDPVQPGRLLVKRLVGLPRERVTLDAGEILVNGRVLRKSLHEFGRVAIPVADEHFPSAHWASLAASSHWWSDVPQPDDVMPLLEESGAADPESDGAWIWRSFRPRPSAANSTSRVLDDYPFNPTVSRRLNVVADLLVQCQLAADRRGQVIFHANARKSSWVLWWRASLGHVQLLRDRQLVAERTWAGAGTNHDGRVWLEFALCDGQILCGVDGHPLLTHRMTDERKPVADTPLLTLAVFPPRTPVKRLRVLRDVYHLSARGVQALPLPRLLGRDEYFVVGDNSPCSVDSRHRHVGPVRRQAIMGTVTPWRTWPATKDGRP
jgi:type IV secretory pathway protease TraF